ncbi:MAG: DUF4476 domain-containing protein [Ferruginibacter sp.]
MKHLKFAFLVFFLFSISGIKAQQNHFIYIQTENKQPFYVKLEKKLYSSTVSGYLVLPKLKDGSYNLGIGFPKSEWTEQNMVCVISDNDLGYLLKNFESKGWALFNLQTLAMIMTSDTAKVNNILVVNKTDAFSNMLSTVVNDSTIRQTEIVKEEKKLPVKEDEKVIPAESVEKDSTQQQQVAADLPKEDSKIILDSAVKNTTVTTVPVEKTGSVKEQVPVVLKSSITRSLFNTNGEGTEMIFIDEINGEKDTIRVFIPADKTTAPVVQEQPKKIEEPKVTPVKPVENPPVETSVPGNKDSVKADMGKPVQKPADPVVQRTPMINSDCKSLASEEDFLKLRKKMAAEENDDDMIKLAKKLFKAKCFTVEQVKNLSVLFLKDSGKYAFFDMAYPFVSDSHNFSTLQSQLSDTYYINRFQSMIRH